jgi:hypothetical protein
MDFEAETLEEDRLQCVINCSYSSLIKDIHMVNS